MGQNINNRNEWYRLLPKMDELFAQDWTNALIRTYGKTPVVTALRSGLEQIREQIPGFHMKEELSEALEQYPGQVPAGIVALTKYDRIEPQEAAGIVEEIRAGLQGTVCVTWPFVMVSSLTGYGLPCDTHV